MRRGTSRRSGRRSTRSDGESLRRAAHGLKGAAANFDADGVVSAARTLEEIGRTGEFGGHQDAWQALTTETDRLISILRTVITAITAAQLVKTQSPAGHASCTSSRCLMEEISHVE